MGVTRMDTTTAHNTAENRSVNLHSHPPGNLRWRLLEGWTSRV